MIRFKLLLGLCLLAGSFVSLPAADAQLRIGYVGHDHQLALYVAAREGQQMIEKYGLGLKELKAKEVYQLIENGKSLAAIRLIKTGGGAGIPAAMEKKQIDLGFGGTMAFAKFRDKGQPFVIIAPLQVDGDMLVMHKDSPINSWDDFVKTTQSASRPLRIGYKAPVAVAKLVFERALRETGISYSTDPGKTGEVQVLLVNFGSEKGPIPLLAAKGIDGFVMNQPVPAVTVHKGVGKIVAELKDLPPKGKWLGHPCCCIGAREEVLTAQPAAVKALLKLIVLAGERINDDPEAAIAHATAWIKNPAEVEKASVPTVTYISEPDKAWLTGMNTWAEMLAEIKVFRGKYKEVAPADFVTDLCKIELVIQAITELRTAGHLPKP